MQIDSLRYFYDVANLKSISKVANNSHISQPALSQQLFKLEENLGVKLLERSNRGVTLTTEGEILFKYSGEILKSYNHLIKELKNHENNKKEVVIETNFVSGKYIINNIIKKVINEFKEYEIKINNNCMDEGYMNLLHNVSDIVVGNRRIDDIALNSSYLGSDKYILIHSSKYKIRKIQEVPFIRIEDNLIKEDDLGKLNLLGNAIICTNSIETVKECLVSYPSIALVPKITVLKELKEKIFIDMENNEVDITYDFFITYKKNIVKNAKNKINTIIESLEQNLNDEKFK